mgnify:CR=1 FL=1
MNTCHNVPVRGINEAFIGDTRLVVSTAPPAGIWPVPASREVSRSSAEVFSSLKIVTATDNKPVTHHCDTKAGRCWHDLSPTFSPLFSGFYRVWNPRWTTTSSSDLYIGSIPLSFPPRTKSGKLRRRRELLKVMHRALTVEPVTGYTYTWQMLTLLLRFSGLAYS